MLTPFAFIYWHSISGDAAIYFTFIKRFFELPFSFRPGTVSFGASSPLHVMIHAPVFAVFGEQHWLAASKVINLSFIGVAVVLVNAAVDGGLVTLALTAMLAGLSGELFTASASLFETPLAFAVVALAYYGVRRGRGAISVAAAGLLYLVRPELVLLAAVIALMTVAQMRAHGRTWQACLGTLSIAALPAVLYHVYMFAGSGELVPSSVRARAIAAMEIQQAWTIRIATSLRALTGTDGWLYVAAVCAAVSAVVAGRVRSYAVEAMLIGAVVAPFVAVPPLGYTPRYLLAAAPLAIALIACEARAIGRVVLAVAPAEVGRAGRIAAASVIALLTGAQAVNAYGYRTHPRYDYDTVLLKDFAAVLNPIASPGEAVMVYEAQAQYYLQPPVLSLDGVVGNDLHDVLARRTTLTRFLRDRPGVRFVATMDSFNYRRLYAGTVLERLYVHDLDSPLGGALEEDGVRFVKIATNPVFSEPALHRHLAMASLNTGTAIRVYGSWNPLWADHAPLWNSLYRIDR